MVIQTSRPHHVISSQTSAFKLVTSSPQETHKFSSSCEYTHETLPRLFSFNYEEILKKIRSLKYTQKSVIYITKFVPRVFLIFIHLVFFFFTPSCPHPCYPLMTLTSVGLGAGSRVMGESWGPLTARGPLRELAISKKEPRLHVTVFPNSESLLERDSRNL